MQIKIITKKKLFKKLETKEFKEDFRITIIYLFFNL